MPFDPKAHVGKFKDRDYMDVANRLLWINEDAPRFEIETDLIQFDETRAVVKATVTVLTDDGQRTKRAVAHGLAIKASLPAMLAPRYLEKAETSAVGRALSMLGYGTQYAQEFDDAADEHLADSPRERKPTPRAAQTAAGPPAATGSATGRGSPTPTSRPVAPPSGLPHPEHAPLGEPQPITDFFERTREHWHASRAETRLLLDPQGLDDDLDDASAVKAALARLDRPNTAKGLDQLFTLCTPSRELITA